MKKKIYNCPDCELVSIRIEKKFLASTDQQYSSAHAIEDMNYDGSELDW